MIGLPLQKTLEASRQDGGDFSNMGRSPVRIGEQFGRHKRSSEQLLEAVTLCTQAICLRFFAHHKL
jgi:hypothetical protein